MHIKPSTPISFVATGNEVTSGEIMNTNVREMARLLSSHHMFIRFHLAATDDEDDIRDAIEFAAKRSRAIITIGGLGPTTDDKTRQALSRACGLKLIWSEESWQALLKRAARFDRVLHESDRQQVYFPEGATIIPNENGTAAGCYFESSGVHYFMLPGPPAECMPLFKNVVIPRLIEAGFQTQQRMYRWRLMGASEAETAAEVDELAKPYGVTTGYRYSYPYLDVKIMTKDSNENYLPLFEKLDRVLSRYFVTKEDLLATEILAKYFEADDFHLDLNDQLTRGLFLQKMQERSVHLSLKKNTEGKKIRVKATGLDFYWDHQPYEGKIELKTEVDYQGVLFQRELWVPYRGPAVLSYAVEFIAFSILKALESFDRSTS
jgi:molybdenum cofactor synthesis domain-containing protein